MICQSGTLNLKNLKIGLSPCQCSMARNGQKRTRRVLYFKFRNVKMYAKRFSQGHWTFLGPGDEKK